MDRIANMINKYRWLIVIFFVGITVLFIPFLHDIKLDSDVKNQLPEDMSTRLTLDKIEEIFGGTDIAMIIIESDNLLSEKTLRRTKKLSREIKKIKEVDKVLSLFELKEIVGEGYAMIVNPAVKRIPKNDEESEILRQRLKENDIVYGSVVAKDFSATAIIALLKADADNKAFVNSAKRIVKENPGDEKISYGGMVFTRMAVGQDMQSDLRTLLPIGLLLMLIFLFACFRQLRGVLLPFSVVLMAIVIVMALIPIFNWKVQLITILLPVIIMAIANDYGIHLINNYQEDNYSGNSFTKAELSKRTFKTLAKPIIATGITTIAGMLCLLSHIIVPAKQLGLLAGIGILFALLASLFFIPAVLSILPKPKPVIHKNSNSKHIIERLLHRIAVGVTTKPKQILLSSFIIIAIMSAGIGFIIVDTNPENYYHEDSPVVKASQTVNRHFGGSNAISVVATGDIKDPVNMKKIDKLEKEIESLENVGITNSIARIVRQMSRALNQPDEKGYDQIPDTRNAVAQYFMLYNMSGEPDDFEKLVDFNYENAQINARITSLSSEEIKETVGKIEELTERDSLFQTIGGFSAIFSQLIDEVVDGQVLSLILSVVIVALFVMILFRSIYAGLMGIIPLLFSLIFLFGFMGYASIELNIATAMLSSIMVGVGIDYTIHFLWRYKEERKNEADRSNAIIKTLTTTGRGIIFNALSVVFGFAVLLLSNFLPVTFFGYLVVITISTCLIGALLILPAVCLVFRPSFLEPKIETSNRRDNIMFNKTNKKPRFMEVNMKKTFKTITLLFALSLLLTSSVSAIDARSIVKEAQNATKLRGAEAVSTLTIYDSSGNKRIRKIATVMKRTSSSTEKKLMRFLSPADVKGTGFLTFDYDDSDDDMWLYMPALRKTRRIVSSEKSKNFMGSEFSYSDMSLPKIDDFSYRHTGNDTSNGVSCYIIEIIPNNDDIADEYGFSRKIAYFSKTDKLLRKAIYYDLDGSLHKEINVYSIKLVDKANKKYRPTHMEIVNKQNGRKSKMIINKIVFSPDVKEDYFTTRYLERE